MFRESTCGRSLAWTDLRCCRKLRRSSKPSVRLRGCGAILDMRTRVVLSVGVGPTEARDKTAGPVADSLAPTPSDYDAPSHAMATISPLEDSHRDGPGLGTRRLRTRTYVVAAVVIVVLLVIAFYSLVGFYPHATSSGTKSVLVPVDTLYSLPAEQFDAVVVTTQSTALVNGTFSHTGSLVLYTMTVKQEQALAINDSVSGYEWTSGLITDNLTITYIELNLAPGNWYLIFLNPSTNPNDSSSVGFLTDLTVSES